MYIKASSPELQANQMVLKLGQYLYKNLDSAYDFKRSGNTTDVYLIVLFQPYDEAEYEEMKVNISITTYQNKIRVNILEVDPLERTIGSKVFFPDTLKQFPDAKKKILSYVENRLKKVYNNYDFYFPIH